MQMIEEGSGMFSGVVPLLVHVLENGNRKDQWRAIEALRSIGPDSKSAVPTLIEFLDVQYKLQSSAAMALGSIGSSAKEAVQPLIQIMLGKCPTHDYAHYAAASALGCIRDEASIPALIEAAQDPAEQGPGSRAIYALSKFGPTAIAAVPSLVALLSQSEHTENTCGIVEAIAEIGPSNGIGCVAIMDLISSHPEDELRANYAQKLYHIMFSGGSPHPAVAHVFIRLLKDTDAEVVNWSAIALGHLREPHAVSTLIEVVNSRLATYVRVEAIHSIGRIGCASDEVINLLSQLLLNSDEKIRCAAAFSASLIGAPARNLLPMLKESFARGQLKAAWLNEKDVLHKIEG